MQHLFRNLALVALLAAVVVGVAPGVNAQGDGPVTALVVRSVTADPATFESTRDAYVADLEAQPGITADREFEPFISFLTFGEPDPPVFIGMTSGTSASDFQQAAGAVDEELTAAYFPTFEAEFFDLLTPLDGAPVDITRVADQPGQVLEVAWRDLSSYDDFDQAAYESARDDYLAALAEQDGWVAEYQWVSASGQPFVVGMTVYESQEKFVAIATDAEFTASDVYADFVGAYPIAGGYASLSVKPAAGAQDELAFTGASSGALAVVGAALLGGGVMVAGAAGSLRRRSNRI